uniref:R-spondin 3 n=1 Tax=Callorhinchus milii TaxID=7868 RepID=A0A4W3III2_CALMI
PKSLHLALSLVSFKTRLKTLLLDYAFANTNVGQGCPNGCDRCSEYNGCLSCKPRLFFFLERNGMRQTGVCLSSCPSGYYGIRTREMNKCTTTIVQYNCDTCFNKNFCTKCKAGFYLHKGRCFDICPEGFTPNNQTMECATAVHCEVSEWSLWSPCTKRGKTCGFRKGSESRSREIVQRSSAHGNPCPKTSETRKCTVQKKRCPKGGKGKRIQGQSRSSYKSETIPCPETLQCCIFTESISAISRKTL